MKSMLLVLLTVLLIGCSTAINEHPDNAGVQKDIQHKSVLYILNENGKWTESPPRRERVTVNLHKPKPQKPQKKVAKKVPDDAAVCLALMVLGEAGGETEEGKVAVAYTAVHRQKSGYYPRDLCRVVQQPAQYHAIVIKNPNMEIPDLSKRYAKANWEDCLRIARGVISGEIPDPLDGATHFFAPELMEVDDAGNKKSPKWASTLTWVGEIGGHVFYRI